MELGQFLETLELENDAFTYANKIDTVKHNF